MNGNMQKLMQVFAEVFDDQHFQLIPETELRQIKNWDSINLISLALGIEKAFKIKLSSVDINTFRTIADIIQLLEAKSISMMAEVSIS